eukprot:1160419-Pelagomonas_calceolata.AAC.3
MLEKCLNFGAGKSGRSDVLSWERVASSKASQVVLWKGLPSRFTQEGCVCKGVIILNSLMFGNGICAFVARNSNMRLNLVEINGDR